MPKLDTTKNGLVVGKALPAKDGYKITPGSALGAGEAFNTHDDTIVAVRLAIIGMYKAQGMSDAQAVAKFNEQNPNF